MHFTTLDIFLSREIEPTGSTDVYTPTTKNNSNRSIDIPTNSDNNKDINKNNNNNNINNDNSNVDNLLRNEFGDSIMEVLLDLFVHADGKQA